MPGIHPGTGRYSTLSRRIASRIGAMPFADRAFLIVEDTVDHIWEELPEFERIPPGKRDDIERGLLELMAEAFSSMDGEALALFKAGKVPRQSAGDPPLPVYRRFAIKLATKTLPRESGFSVLRTTIQEMDCCAALRRSSALRRTSLNLTTCDALSTRTSPMDRATI